MSSSGNKDLTPFAKLVYEYCKKVPKGKIIFDMLHIC